MQWLKRHWRWMLVAFALTSVLVFGGLTWATVVSLELQRAESERTLERTIDYMIDKGTSMMDDALSDPLFLEDRRDFWEYRHTACDEDTGCRGDPKVFLDLDNGMLPAWIRGHFQLSLAEGWSSPWQFVDVENGLSELTQSSLVQPWFEALRQNLTYEDVQRQISEMSWFREFRRSSLAPRLVADSQQTTVRTSANRPASLDRSVPDGMRTRNSDIGSTPADFCISMPRYMAFSALFKSPETVLGLAVPDSDDNEAETMVFTHRLMPVWFKPGDQPVILTYIRSVEVAPGVIVYQGFAIDWDRLAHELLAEVKQEIFPNASLVRVFEQPANPSLAMLRNLPARLETGAVAMADMSGGWTVFHAAIAAAWVSALCLFAAIVLGVRNLISFAERRMQFTYDVTHELRTPLTTMRLYTEMLSSGLIQDEKTRHEYLQTLDHETERLSGLVAGVLEYARLENRSPRIEEAPATVGDIIQETRNRWEPYCEREGHKFAAECNGLASTHLKTDRRLVQQILNILVDNACKYGRSESEPAVVVRALKLNDGRIAIDVQDNGPGVPSRDRKSIFRPFRRGTITEVGGVIPTGIGLGLALARRWARLLGGRVDCVKHEKQTRGACFRLILPKKAQVDREARSTTAGAAN